jgi:probable DNA metabolism protein
MSELPIEAELLRFARKILSAAREAALQAGPGTLPSDRLKVQLAERREAERVFADRGDPDVWAVQEAAAKVRREVHRLLGFLRFSLAEGDFYIARCAPDYFVLPALGPHFGRRLGEIPWGIIDERRKLSLIRPPGGELELFTGVFPDFPSSAGVPLSHSDPWEDLWRLYHRSVTIENRKNPALQRQFMPLRYWKYLPEVRPPFP